MTTSATTGDSTQASSSHATHGRHPGIALAIIAGVQLMIVLDATVVNVALPHVQRALGFSESSLSWVLNAYTLAFGGLLLLGGRAGDILGRRRVFLAGIGLFSVASLLGGFAQSSEWLLTARALQGVGAAIASPTALALIMSNFSEGPERNKAFGVFAGVSAAGSAIGLLLGGILTELLSWRWVLFINVPIGILLAMLAPRYLRESKPQPGRFDATGAIVSTVGLTAIVYGFIRAGEPNGGWTDGLTITAFIVGVALLASFALIETRHSQPIVPLHMFRDRNRSGAYGVMFVLVAAMFGMFFFLTQFVQNVLDYGPLRAGFAFLPISAIIIVGAQFSSTFLARTGAKPFMVAGGVLTTLGVFWISRLSVDTSYVELLGGMLLFGLGMGLIFVPITAVSVSNVEPQESGAASALFNVMQQVGGSVGLSILVTTFTSSLNDERSRIAESAANGTPPPKNAVDLVFTHGVSSAFGAASIFAAVALVLTAVLIRNVKADPSQLAPGA